MAVFGNVRVAMGVSAAVLSLTVLAPREAFAQG